MTDIARMSTLWVWYLANPQAPEKVGAVSLVSATKRCSFTYDATWKESGFPLSPDMPFGRRGSVDVILPPVGWEAPGALDDAMPDRWGQSTIRVIDRPKRLTALDFLYYAGDRRFGALGVSSSPDEYRPYPDTPLITVRSLE